MSFLASALGALVQVVAAVSESGQLAVTTAKPQYTSGELITGTIYAQIFRPVSCRAIVVRCVAYEKVEWNEKITRTIQRPGTGTPERPAEFETEYRIIRHRAKQTFFDVAIPVYNLMDGVLLPGNYSWPFQYQLPAGLPGSFHERRELRDIQPGTIFEDAHDHTFGEERFYDSDDELDYAGPYQGSRRYERPEIHAVVHYKLKAVLDVNGVFAPDLHAKVGLVVQPALTLPITPQTAMRDTNVMVCCCINKGKAKLTCSFDKNAYVAGETAQISADIDNQSTKELKMTVRLHRNLTLKDHAGRLHVLSEVVNQADYDAAPPMQHCQKQLPLAFTNPLIKPTISGSYVNCSYSYAVVGRVSWGTDININLPVHIYAPQPPPTLYAVPAWATAAPTQVVPVQPAVYAQAQVQSQPTGYPPQQGYAPAPVPAQGYAPAPAQGYAPAPIQGYAPAPVQGYAPAPAQGYAPAPAQGYAPAPAQPLF